MLRMKKAKAEAAAAAASTPMETESTNIEADDKGSGGLKLLGVGGKSGTTAGAKKSSIKKRTAGEIRVQKGI